MQHGQPLDPQALANVELFAGLPPAALAEMLRHARVLELPKDTIVFSQGMKADYGHVLLAGRVRIRQSDEEGAELLVRFIGAGETFGTVALFTGGTYPAEAATVVDSVVASWPESVLTSFMERHPRLALNIVKIIGARLREVQERLREVATQRAHQRIARVLLRLHAQDQGASPSGYPLSRQDVAAMCGTTLHTASRVLTEWEKRGLLSTHRQHVTLHRLEEIQRIADDQGA
jgi:CRP-like cAMP-binding protein